jgi:hypothetical protein
LIASLQHKWLGTFGSLDQQVTGQFDLDRAKYAAKRPTGNCSGKIFDSDGKRLCFFARLRGQTDATAGKKRDARTRIWCDRQTSVSIGQRNCRSF